MKNILYASAVGSIMYAQIYTRPDIVLVVEILGRYHSNPDMDHWRAAKKVVRYLQGDICYEGYKRMGMRFPCLLVVLSSFHPRKVKHAWFIFPVTGLK